MHTFAAATSLATLLLVAGQQQAPNARSNWPCGARIDMSYFQISEGSGGHLLLLAPDEIADSAPLLTAFGSHGQTIFRLAGSLKSGVHELRVPIDPTVESALFSVSVQCLQVASLVRPSGVLATGDDVTELTSFRAERMFIVKRPEPGEWTIRVSGSGVAGVVAQARSEIGIAQVQFAATGKETFTPIPTPGVENIVKIHVSGKVSGVKAALMSGEFRRIAELPLETGEADGAYVSRLTPRAEGFRILVTGTTVEGVAFQRLTAPLLTPFR
jgi:hypothetical protein